MLDIDGSGPSAPTPPTGGSHRAEQPTEADHVATGDHGDELIELGARVAFEIPAVEGTCPPGEVIAQASARIGLDNGEGRYALSAYVGHLNAILRPVTLTGHQPLPSLDEVPA